MDPKHASNGGGRSRESLGRRTALAAGVTALVLGLVAVVAYAAEVFLLLFAGILFAVFLCGLTDLVRRHSRLSRNLSLAGVCLVFLIVAAAAIALLVPVISNGVEKMSKTLPSTLSQARERITRHPLGERAMSLASRVPMGPSKKMTQRMAMFAGSSLGALGSLVVVLFIGLYLASDPGLYRQGLLRLLPLEKRKPGGEVLDELQNSLWWWLIGKLIGMAVVGVTVTVGLLIIGVPLAPVWGILAGLLEFIPNIGPLLSAIPAIVFAFAEGPSQALYVVALYLVVQGLQSYLVEPKIQKSLVSLPPGLLLFSQLLFGMLLGFMGLLLATPLTVAAMVLARKVYVENTLERPAD